MDLNKLHKALGESKVSIFDDEYDLLANSGKAQETPMMGMARAKAGDITSPREDLRPVVWEDAQGGKGQPGDPSDPNAPINLNPAGGKGDKDKGDPSDGAGNEAGTEEADGQGQGQGQGKGQGGKPGQGQGSGSGGDPSDNGSEDGQGSGSGAGTEDGEGQPQGGKPGSGGKGGKPSKSQEEFDAEIDGGWVDDHSHLGESDATLGPLIKKVLREVEPEYRKRNGAQQAGKGQGADLIGRVKASLKEDFDISAVKSRLAIYKRALSESKGKEENYYGSAFGPDFNGVIRPRNIEQKVTKKASAVLFFAADVSGSITSADYSAITGYLDSIYTQFIKADPMAGEVFLFEWSDTAMAPVRKYKGNIKPRVKNMSDEQLEKLEAARKEGDMVKLRIGGGTDVNSVFKFMDKNFYEEDAKGDGYFKLNPKGEEFKYSDDPVQHEKQRKAMGDGELSDQPINVKLKKKAATSFKEAGPGHVSVAESRLVITQPMMSNAPFLIIYTDGYFSPPTYQSKLFAGAPGNIIYIVTSRAGIANLKPANFIYHNVHGDEE
jgi:hypothetical protein